MVKVNVLCKLAYIHTGFCALDLLSVLNSINVLRVKFNWVNEMTSLQTGLHDTAMPRGWGCTADWFPCRLSLGRWQEPAIPYAYIMCLKLCTALGFHRTIVSDLASKLSFIRHAARDFILLNGNFSCLHHSDFRILNPPEGRSVAVHGMFDIHTSLFIFGWI